MAEPVKFIDNPLAPEVYATSATGFFVANGNISITFEAVRVDHSVSPGAVARIAVQRVVLPLAGAQSLALGLFDFLEKQGLGFKKP